METHLNEDGRLILRGANGQEHDITSNEYVAEAAREAKEKDVAETATRHANARAAWKARFGS